MAQFELVTASIDEIREAAVTAAQIRPGVAEFFTWCASAQIPVVVASHGMDLYVESVLEARALTPTEVLCGRTLMSGAQPRVSYEHLLDEAFAEERDQKRLAVLRARASGRSPVLIGDSRWDYPAATLADTVFARDGLLAECKGHGVPCLPFEDFSDILGALTASAGSH